MDQYWIKSNKTDAALEKRRKAQDYPQEPPRKKSREERKDIFRLPDVVSKTVHLPALPEKKKIEFSHYIVLDFETTCWDSKETKNKLANPDQVEQGKQELLQEVIEWSCVLYDPILKEITSEYSVYVNPTFNPILSQFCKDLTGIKQEQVDNGVSLVEALKGFQEWFDGKNLSRPIMATWSDWDLQTALAREARWKNVKVPMILQEWIDLKAAYRRHYKQTPHGVGGTLQALGHEFDGQCHSGIDDARNTVKILSSLLKDGAELTLSTTRKPVEKTPPNSLAPTVQVPQRRTGPVSSHIPENVILDINHVTAPLCKCGKRANRRIITNPSSNNHGTTEFTCKVCNFHQWLQ